jgi:hypothetical protein
MGKYVPSKILNARLSQSANSALPFSLFSMGRSTFEGTLKATFADYFSYEKEGAFANIILQNGLSGAIGYVCT